MGLPAFRPGSAVREAASLAANDTFAITKPTGIQVGDVVDAILGYDNDSLSRVVFPASWTQIFAFSYKASGSVHRYFKKITQADLDATNLGFGSLGGGSAAFQYGLIALLNVNLVNPIDAWSHFDNGGSTSHPCPSVNTGGPDKLVVVSLADNSNSSLVSYPTGTRGRFFGGSTAQGCMGIADFDVSAQGASGEKTFTLGSSIQGLDVTVSYNGVDGGDLVGMVGI